MATTKEILAAMRAANPNEYVYSLDAEISEIKALYERIELVTADIERMVSAPNAPWIGIAAAKGWLEILRKPEGQ